MMFSERTARYRPLPPNDENSRGKVQNVCRHSSVDDHVSVILLTNAHVIANLTGIVLQTLQFYLPGLKH